MSAYCCDMWPSAIVSNIINSSACWTYSFIFNKSTVRNNFSNRHQYSSNAFSTIVTSFGISSSSNAPMGVLTVERSARVWKM